VGVVIEGFAGKRICFTGECLCQINGGTIRQLNELQAATLPARTTAVEIARLTSRACSAFRTQEESEQRKLLSIVLKGASWKDQKLQTALFEPFELVRRSNHTNGNQINRLPVQKGDFQNWLPKPDSNLTLTPMP